MTEISTHIKFYIDDDIKSIVLKKFCSNLTARSLAYTYRARHLHPLSYNNGYSAFVHNDWFSTTTKLVPRVHFYIFRYKRRLWVSKNPIPSVYDECPKDSLVIRYEAEVSLVCYDPMEHCYIYAGMTISQVPLNTLFKNFY